MRTLEEAAGVDGKLTAGEFQAWFDSVLDILPADVLQADFDLAAFQVDILTAFNNGAPMGSIIPPSISGLPGFTPMPEGTTPSSGSY